jgi:hypothetical protein
MMLSTQNNLKQQIVLFELHAHQRQNKQVVKCLVTCILVLRLDLIYEFFQTAELLDRHSMEVLELNEPFFSILWSKKTKQQNKHKIIVKFKN